MKCVELGIFKDILEAKQYRRDMMIRESQYDFKHLLYRK